MITAEQLRGARAMLRWDQKQLADAAGVSVPTIKRMEGSAGQIRGTYENVTSIISTLESAGIQFVPGGVILGRAPNVTTTS